MFISSIKCIALNCNSLVHLARRTELNQFVKSTDPDILLLSETHLSAKHKLHIPGYTIYRTHSSTTKPFAAGTAIAIRQSIPHCNIVSLVQDTCEATCLSIKTQGDVVAFASFYGRPKIDENHLTKLFSLESKVVVGGDFNARHTSWDTKDNNNGKMLIKFCEDNDLQLNIPDHPTYHKVNHSSKIDLVISKDICLLKPIITSYGFCSDHNPIEFIVPVHCAPPTAPKKRPNFNKADWTRFKLFIQQRIQIKPIDSTDILDSSVQHLSDVIQTAIHKTIPKTSNQHKDEIPDEIVSLIKKRNCLRRYCNLRNSAAVKKEVNFLTRVIHHKVVEHRNVIFSKKLSEFDKHDPNIFEQIRRVKGGQTFNTLHIKKDGQAIIDPVLVNEEIANHYEKIHSSNESMGSIGFTNEVNGVVGSFVSHEISSGFDCPVTFEEIHLILKNIKNKKSPGIDSIPNIALKNLPPKAVSLLVEITNAIMKLGHFPDAWKMAKVIPIPKVGKPPDNAANTRPISLLCGISKIAEITINKRLLSHIYANNLLPDEQFGFRQGRSTTQALCRLTNHVRYTRRFGRATTAIFLDIEKAFDTVWHNGLIYKLIMAKFPPFLIKTVHSYLKNRKFVVSRNSLNSSVKSVSAGVPQGSVLGPHLYSFYTHDTPRTDNTFLQMYADDTTVYATSTSNRLSSVRLQSHLNLLAEYYFKWKIKINPTKTEQITFTARKPSRFPANPISLNGATIKPSKSVKYLGVQLSFDLKFVEHIQSVRRKACMAQSLLYPFFKRNSGLSTENTLLLYKIYIRPIITYACPVWFELSNKTCRNHLQVRQNKALRFVFDEWRRPPLYQSASIAEMHDRANLMTIEQFISHLCSRFLVKLYDDESQFLRSIIYKPNLGLVADLAAV